MSTELRLAVGLQAVNVEFTIQRTDIGGQPTRTISVPDGTYYMLGDGSAEDILGVVQDLVTTHGELSEFRLRFNPSEPELGIAQAVMNTIGQTATLTWTANGVDLRDWLRFGGASLAVTDIESVGSRMVRGLFIPRHHRSAIQDLIGDIPEASQAYSDDRMVMNTVTFAEPRRWQLEFGCAGSPFATVATEYHAFRDLVRLISSGLGFRYYRDRTNSAPWAEIDEPAGYSQLKLDASDFGWAPPPRYGNYYKRWSKRLLCWETSG
jgi:hypothetical protein